MKHNHKTGEVFDDIICRGCGHNEPTNPKDSMATPLNASGDEVDRDWQSKFDEMFSRKNQQTGKYEEKWFVKEAITSKEVKEFIENTLIKILAEMESCSTAKEARHLIKEYLLHEK